MNAQDRIRFQHMLEAARDALTFAAGKDLAALQRDRMFFMAVVKAVEIMGEAAAHVSNETRRAYPALPWAGMIGMRNILVHAYFSVDLDQLWDTLENDIPGLAVALEKIIAEDELG